MSLFILCLRNSMVGTTLPAVPSVRSAKSRHSSILGVGLLGAFAQSALRHSFSFFSAVEFSHAIYFPFFPLHAPRARFPLPSGNHHASGDILIIRYTRNSYTTILR